MWRVVVAVLVSCSGLVAGTHAATAAKPTPADQTVLNAGYLTLNDLPSGFREGPNAGQTDYSKYGAPCRQIATAIKACSAYGSSSRFTRGNEVTADAVAVFRTPEAGVALQRTVQGSRAQDCFKKALLTSINQNAAQTGVSVSSVSIGRLSIAPIGDQSVGYEVVVQVAKSGLSVTLYADITFTVVGRVAIAFSVSNVGTSASGDFEPQFQPAVSRVRAAEGSG